MLPTQIFGDGDTPSLPTDLVHSPNGLQRKRRLSMNPILTRPSATLSHPIGETRPDEKS